MCLTLTIGGLAVLDITSLGWPNLDWIQANKKADLVSQKYITVHYQYNYYRCITVEYSILVLH